MKNRAASPGVILRAPAGDLLPDVTAYTTGQRDGVNVRAAYQKWLVIQDVPARRERQAVSLLFLTVSQSPCIMSEHLNGFLVARGRWRWDKIGWGHGDFAP
jgi:hypothetical protein